MSSEVHAGLVFFFFGLCVLLAFGTGGLFVQFFACGVVAFGLLSFRLMPDMVISR